MKFITVLALFFLSASSFAAELHGTFNGVAKFYDGNKTDLIQQFTCVVTAAIEPSKVWLETPKTKNQACQLVNSLRFIIAGTDVYTINQEGTAGEKVGAVDNTGTINAAISIDENSSLLVLIQKTSDKSARLKLETNVKRRFDENKAPLMGFDVSGTADLN